MGKRIALGTGFRVIADEHGGSETVIEILDHAGWMTAPAANDPHAIRQLLGQDIPAAVMGILQQDVGGPGGNGAFASGNRST